MPRKWSPSGPAHGIVGVVAGLTGAGAVDLANRSAERVGVTRRPTLPARLVGKSLRLPQASSRSPGPIRRAVGETLDVHPASGVEQERVERIGVIAHYTWGALWGVLAATLQRRMRSRITGALTHGLAFVITDDVLLASANVGTPIWGSHGRDRDTALQLGQLVLYIVTANLACRHTEPRVRPQPRTARDCPIDGVTGSEAPGVSRGKDQS